MSTVLCEWENEEYLHTLSPEGFAAGKVSTGFIHATPGEIKSFKSSADRIALMIPFEGLRTLNAPLFLFKI